MTNDQDSRRAQAILDAGAALVSSPTPALALDAVGRCLGEGLDAAVVEIWSYSPSRDALTCAARWARDVAVVPEAGGVGTVVPADRRPHARAAIAGREPVVCQRDADGLDAGLQAAMESAGETSRIDVPLLAGDDVLGVLTLAETGDARSLTADERAFVGHIAQFAAIGLSNAALVRLQESHERRLLSLVGSSKILSTSLDIDDTFRHVRSEIAKAAGEGCGVSLYVRSSAGAYEAWNERVEGDGPALFEAAPNGAAATPAGPPADPLAAQALERRRPLMAKVAGERVRVVVPLVVRDETVGYIDVGPLMHQPGRQELAVLQVLASHAAVAVEATRLFRAAERQSATDVATGLYNRWYFFERLYSETARAYRYKQPLSLILAEIDELDHFMKIRGTTDGDKVMRGVARLMTKSLRNKVDVPCRLGGPVFGILLPNTPCGNPGAGLVADRLRTTVEKTELRNEDHELLGKFTITQGIAAYPLHAEDADDLVEVAEEALKAAHEAGGNKIKLYASRKV